MGRDGLAAFLAGDRIAVVGVSASELDPSRVVFRALAARGKLVVPVRAGVEHIEGHQAYARLQEVPGPVDGVLIMSRHRVSDLVDDCAEIGCRQLWLCGPPLDPELAATCGRHQIAVVTRGPDALTGGEGRLRRAFRRLTGSWHV
ncbi:MAG: CoA-binding protein [Kofleriaceae bacterium]